MRIAQVSPLYESVPPHPYGGTEGVASYLTEEILRQGHEVTLFASGDFRTAAEPVPVCARALRLDPSVVDPSAHPVLQLERVQQRELEEEELARDLERRAAELRERFRSAF